MGRPVSYPTGVTYYNPEKCYNGYTIYCKASVGSILIDMNGKPVHVWDGLIGQPTKMLPEGRVMSSRGNRPAHVSYMDFLDVVTCEWNGDVTWEYSKYEYCEDDGREPRYTARQHHEFQRYGEPPYFTPGAKYPKEAPKTLILVHKDVKKKKISPQLLEDDVLIEVDNEGNTIWEWHSVDHFNEMGFDETARNAIFRDPNTNPSGPNGQGDWIHLNCASYLGENKWYDAGDKRFHPDNIILDSREGSFLFIIDHETGKIVWKVGPDYTSTKELRLLGAIIGPHATHMIPKGLPGEGNILVFDNGGWAGYGAPSQVSRYGLKSMRRDSSRIIEFDPITLKVVWEFDEKDIQFPQLFASHYFYSPLISNVQRLPNGNTLIDEGCDGHMFEVTPEKEIVWDYVTPYSDAGTGNMVYRCYRIPYDWVPQLDKPEENPVERVDNRTFQVPGAASPLYDEADVVSVEGVVRTDTNISLCVEKL